MKILHLGKFYTPFRGGMETVLQNLMEGLLDEGLEVRALVSAHDGPQCREDIQGPDSGRTGRLLRAERIATLFSQPINPSLPVLLRREIAHFQPHLVHLHLPNPLALFVWEALAPLLGPDRPGLVLWHHADITRQKVGASLLSAWEGGAYRRCRGVCVSSGALAEGSRHRAAWSRHVAVIPFGIRPEPWTGISPGLDGDFLFVGRLVPYKGLEVLLEAVAHCGPEVTLTVVGEGPLGPWLGDRLARSDVRGRVRLVGACGRDELVKLMEHASALVLPSLDTSETFGLVQLEAMASGLPVVASDLPTGVREVGVPGRTCLLVPPGDVPSLAGALECLARDADLRRAMGDRGRQRFLERYTRQTMCRRVADWYRRVLHNEVGS